MSYFSAWIAVSGTVLFTVYGQLILKWRVRGVGLPANDFWGAMFTVLKLLIDPWIMSSMAAAFLASLCWMAAVSKLPLSLAYPFTSISIGVVTVISILLMGEAVTAWKVIGVLLVMSGLIVLSFGSRFG